VNGYRYDAHMKPSPKPSHEMGSNEMRFKIRPTFIRALIGIPVGGLAGLILGVVGWMGIAALLFNNPLAARTDPGPVDLVILLTGPVGGIAGAIAGGVVFRRLKASTIAIIVAVVAMLGGWFAWAFRIGV